MAAWGDLTTTGNRYSGVSTARPAASTFTTFKPLSDGTRGTLETLAAMRQAVTIGLPPEYVSYRDGSTVRAAQVIASAPQNAMSEITALYRFCRDQVAYIDHPWSMQVVQDARRTIQFRTGDCVSKSVCLSTLLASLGYLSRFVAQASTGIDGFDHVYVEASLNGEWLALDPTADGREGRPMGSVGWTQTLEDGGFEMAYEIFERSDS